MTEQKQLYTDGGRLAVPVGNDAGGHGVRLAADSGAPGSVCDVREELAAELVEPEEFGTLEFVEPEFVAVGSAPGFSVAGLEPWFEVAGFVEPAVPGALPGSVPHGDPAGAVPALFAYSGSPSKATCWCQAWLVPEDSGMLPGEVALGDVVPPCGDVCGVVGGVAGCGDEVAFAAGGFALWAGGVAVWAGGVAVPCELWAIVQLATATEYE